MKIWWCQEHESNGQRDTSICYRWALFLASGKELAGDCRMVAMRLIPDNAETVTTLAYLGWSNMRGGTELYSEESGGNGRWATRRVPDPDGQKWGDLLADELATKGVHEGSYLVVVAFPSRFDKAKVEELVAALDGETP